MGKDTESSDDTVEFAALTGLQIDKLIFSRYQLDIEFIDDDLTRMAGATFETEISLKINNKEYVYNIQASSGSIPVGVLFGARISGVLYRKSEFFTLQFERELTLTCCRGAAPEEAVPEFGSIRVFRGDVRFFMPLL